jgi:hypothetical protein
LEALRPDRAVYGRFKLAFPNGVAEPLHGPETSRRAKALYVDMARILYGHIKQFYEKKARPGPTLPYWDMATVDFAFTVPAAAGNPAAVSKELQEVAKEAGFGSLRSHSVLDEVLTEAEASAIYSLNMEKDSLAMQVRRPRRLLRRGPLLPSWR